MANPGVFTGAGNTLQDSTPLLGYDDPEENTSFLSFRSRRSRSLWVFLALSVGVLGFLVYSTVLIFQDAINGDYGWLDIDKPVNDPKIYKYLPELLPNAPPIVVVQDPGAQLTGFAIGVSAGAYYDPVDYPGLAHFTEHMLFLGTEKYPGATSFDEFISSHGGSSNAFTDSERTVYYNAIDTDSFSGGFSRFLEFFSRPSFDQTFIQKEVNAVDSEHDLHINDPHWRMFSLVANMSLPPGNHYSTGDSSTLMAQGSDALTEAVVKYFSANYCFNRLSIAIVSPIPVSDQVEIVRDVFSSISSPIPRNCRPPSNFAELSPQIKQHNGYPIADYNRQRLVYSEGPRGTVPLLWIIFPFRPIGPNGDGGKHPHGILETILTYNGPRSLTQNLLASGLVTSVSFLFDDTSAGSIAYLSFSLSSDARDTAGQVIETCFSFISKLKKQGGVSEQFIQDMQKLRKSLFDSNAEVGGIVNESPMRLAKYFAAQMTTSNRNRTEANLHANELVTANEEILTVDSDLVAEVLGSLDPKNSVILFHDPQYDPGNPPPWVEESVSNFTSELIDEHYGFRFQSGKYREEKVKQWTTSGLADDFTVLSKLTVFPPSIDASAAATNSWSSEEAGRPNKTQIMEPPSKIFTSPGLEVWEKKSVLAGKWLPKVWLWASVRPDKRIILRMNPEELEFNGEMVADCVSVDLRSKLADYILAGYDFSISWGFAGYFEIKVFGWKDGVEKFLSTVVAELSSPSMALFDLVLKEKQESLDRSRMLSDVAGEALNSLVIGSATREDIKGYLNAFPASAKSVKDWVHANFNKAYFTVYQADSSDYSKTTSNMGKELLSSFGQGGGVIAKADDAVYFVSGPKFTKPIEVRMLNPSPNDPNSALLYSLTYGSDMSSRDRVLAALLGSVVDPLIFRTIRTQHQMGYIASGRTGVYPGPAGSVQFRVYIQGNQANPDMMEARLEELLARIPAVLAAIPVEEIAERAAGVAASLEEVPTSAHAEVSQFWGPIYDQSGCFNRGANQAKFLETTDPAVLKQGIQDLFEDFTINRRSKVAVKVWRSENTITVPQWSVQEISGALGEPAVVSALQEERAQTVILNGIGKKERERAFEAAVNSADPMWDPQVPSCEI